MNCPGLLLVVEAAALLSCTLVKRSRSLSWQIGTTITLVTALVPARVFTRPSLCRPHSDQQAGGQRPPLKVPRPGPCSGGYARVHSSEAWPEPVLVSWHSHHFSSPGITSPFQFVVPHEAREGTRTLEAAEMSRC